MEIGGSLIPETLGNVNYEFLQIMNGCRKAFQKNYKARKDGIRRSEFEVGRQGLKCQPPSLVLDILKLRNSLLLRDKFIIECLLTCTLIVPYHRLISLNNVDLTKFVSLIYLLQEK